jgi:hypothetical protein
MALEEIFKDEFYSAQGDRDVADPNQFATPGSRSGESKGNGQCAGNQGAGGGKKRRRGGAGDQPSASGVNAKGRLFENFDLLAARRSRLKADPNRGRCGVPDDSARQAALPERGAFRNYWPF